MANTLLGVSLFVEKEHVTKGYCVQKIIASSWHCRNSSHNLVVNSHRFKVVQHLQNLMFYAESHFSNFATSSSTPLMKHSGNIYLGLTLHRIPYWRSSLKMLGLDPIIGLLYTGAIWRTCWGLHNLETPHTHKYNYRYAKGGCTMLAILH